MACSYCTKKDCRRGRPLCSRPDRKPRDRQCQCDNYPFPHRTGSGRCLYNAQGQERMNALVYGPESQVA